MTDSTTNNDSEQSSETKNDEETANERETYKSWFGALGNPVPHENRARAAEKAREMGLSLDGDEESEFVGGVAEAIERDRPNEAIAKTRDKLDLTGTYRFLSYLCVSPDSEATTADEQSQSEPTPKVPSPTATRGDHSGQ